jgi:radical SAM superfamily enzyme YgiQ (UPF0313 family)
MAHITAVNITIAKTFNDKVVYQHNSVGIFSLIATLEKAGYKASFHEYCLESEYGLSAEIEDFISTVDMDPPIIGIGCHSVHLPFVVKVSQAIKKRFPKKVVVLGGAGPSGVAKEILETFDCIDAVVVGEGEETLVEIVKNGLKGLPEIKGLVYRKAGKVHVNPARPHITDLDKLPPPAYDIVNFKERYQVATVITSRGCPYRCGFCSLTDFDGEKVRYNSIDNVISELKVLSHKYGFKNLFFVDPTFTVNKKRTIELCRRIRLEKLDLSWFCMTRTECVDEELLAEMGKSGCKTVFYGVDTGSEAVLKKIKNGFGLKEVLSVIEKSKRYIDIVEVGLMWGFPFEALDDFKETLKLREHLEKNIGCTVQLRWLEPYPATEIFRRYKKDLFMPEKHSLMFQPEKLEKLLSAGKSYYRNTGDTCRIPADVTSVRFIIAASHIANTCRDIIVKNPYIFSDYYRYKTPALEEKFKLASRYSLY